MHLGLVPIAEFVQKLAVVLLCFCIVVAGDLIESEIYVQRDSDETF